MREILGGTRKQTNFGTPPRVLCAVVGMGGMRAWEAEGVQAKADSSSAAFEPGPSLPLQAGVGVSEAIPRRISSVTCQDCVPYTHLTGDSDRA